MNIFVIIGAVLIVPLVLLIPWYWRDRSRILAKAKAEGQIVQTALGPIECAIFGTGPAILAVHGWGGGGSGGYNMFRFLADQGFTVLSVSRPGYMGTPLTIGETMEAQADALVALLDSLHISRAAVICGSGGGPASILFALRHPERCWGLVLVSALSRREPITNTSPMQQTLEKVFESDFFIWIIAKFFWRGLVESGMGGLNDEIRQDPAKIAALRSLIDGLILGSQCRDGMKNDMRQWKQMPTFPFHTISVPTLIIHSRNDKSIPYKYAEQTTAIPNSKLLLFEDGGHTCYIVYSDATQPATTEFLNAHKPPE